MKRFWAVHNLLGSLVFAWSGTTHLRDAGITLARLEAVVSPFLERAEPSDPCYSFAFGIAEAGFFGEDEAGVVTSMEMQPSTTTPDAR